MSDLVESANTLKPISAMKINAMRNVNAPARKPITGGPIKNPIKLMVETAAIDAPGDMVVDLPAAL